MNLPLLNIIYCFIYCIFSSLSSFIALSGLCERWVILLLFVVNHVSSYKSGQRHGGGTSAAILCYFEADCTLNMKFLTAVNICLRLTNCAMWIQNLERKKKECIHLRENLLKKIEKILEKKYYALIFRTRNSIFMFTCYFQIQEVEK